MVHSKEIAMHSIWTGNINFALLSIPVKIYATSKDTGVKFNFIHTKCKTKINISRHCNRCNRDVLWNELSKGYEVSKNEFVVLSEKDLASGVNSTMEILEFANPKEIDLSLYAKTYFVRPDSKSHHAYNLFCKSLEIADKIAITKIKLKTKVKLASIRSSSNKLFLDILHYSEDMYNFNNIVIDDVSKQVDINELQLALKLINSAVKPFNISNYKDEQSLTISNIIKKKFEKKQNIIGKLKRMSKK